MRKIVLLIAIILLLVNCLDSQSEKSGEINTSLAKDSELQQRKKSNPIEVKQAAHFIGDSTADSSVTKSQCSSAILKKTNNMLNSLDEELVTHFLATFHESCYSNVEYSQWSNELLFKVLIRYPELIVKIISKDSTLSRDYILDELTSPIHDLIDLEATIEKVKKTEISDSNIWKSKIVDAIKKAQEENTSGN